MESTIQTIQKRYSVRTYKDKAVEENTIKKVQQYLKSVTKGPLGSDLRFQIVDATNYDPGELKALGTYGFIKGPKLFIAGAVNKGKFAMEDYGYCMEKNILMVTGLGLGTCWLGGFLNRSTFSGKLKTTENELIPAITPIGYIGDKKTLKENLIRMVAGSKKRKKFEELFFKGDYTTPLSSESSGKYSKVLEAVRLAPSASNKQPWRIFKDPDKDVFHFYLKENASYNNAFKDIKIQNIDMGIAMCHFELVARELGLQGVWETNIPNLTSVELTYIVSWMG